MTTAGNAGVPPVYVYVQAQVDCHVAQDKACLMQQNGCMHNLGSAAATAADNAVRVFVLLGAQ